MYSMGFLPTFAAGGGAPLLFDRRRRFGRVATREPPLRSHSGEGERERIYGCKLGLPDVCDPAA